MDLYLFYMGKMYFNKDKIVSFNHSVKLFELCKSDEKVLRTPAYMNHNEFNLEDDLIIPLQKFIFQINEEKQNNKKNDKKIMLNLLEDYKQK